MSIPSIYNLIEKDDSPSSGGNAITVLRYILDEHNSNCRMKHMNVHTVHT